MKQINGKPDAAKAYAAIALIMSAKDDAVKVRLTSLKKAQDVRKAG